MLLDNLPAAPYRTILDLGSGTGFLLFELADRFGAAAHVIGLDIWDAGLLRGQEKHAIYQQENALQVRYDGAHFPFADSAFDLITANLIVNNLDDPAGVLAECARVTQSGGLLCMTSNVVGHMAEFYEVFRTVLTEHGDPAALERLADNLAHRGTPGSHAALLEAAGFRVRRMVEGRFDFRYADGTALLRAWFIRLGFMGGWLAIVDPQAQADVFRAVERRLNAQAALLGELRLTVPMLYLEAERLPR